MKPRKDSNGIVLVVDDAPSTIDVVRTSLEDAGYQVSVATSGEKALRRVELLTPDLILLDILMPGMDGYQVCQRLKAMEETRDVPIIFLSALEETVDKVKAFELGAVDYLTKPIAPEEMLARVRTQITISRLGKELSAANKYLEERVTGRTAELRAANNALQAEIAERRRAEQELRQANRTLKMLSACNQAVVHATGEKQLLRAICRIVVETGGYPLAWVGYPEQDDIESIRPVTGWGLGAECHDVHRITTWSDAERGQSPAVRAIRSNAPSVVNDVRTDPAFAPWQEEAIARYCVSCVALPLPLHAAGDVFGVLIIHSPAPDVFGEQEVAMLMELATDLAYGVMSLRERAERMRAERELEAIIDNTTAVIYVKDLHGRFLLVNRRFEELFHTSRSEIIGNTDYTYFQAQAADAFRANDQRVIETNAPLEIEESVPSMDGSRIYLSGKFPLRTSDGAVYAVCGVSTDITERKRAEQERIRLVEQLQAAIAARNEFLAIAAHELRTPLTPLTLQVQHFKKLITRGNLETASPAMVGGVVERLERQVARFAKLVEHLLDASQLGSGKLHLDLAETDLREVVREVIDRSAAEITSSGTPVDLDLPEPIVGRWDRMRLEQLVTNLLTNALKYGMKRPVNIAAKRVGDRAMLVVADRGIGIRDEEKVKIFQPFVRAVPYSSISGFGMGLHIVQQIVEAHEATIRVDSEPGKGSTVTVDLPLSGPRAQDI